jgi:uncharacterized protein with NAD-binding domain and iron-sulfur cluster
LSAPSEARKRRILVIGTGPAGLAAGIRLLERARDRVDVRIAHMGHHLGGKAASYTDAQGRDVEHGWHMVLGFYGRMRALMDRAGIRFDQAFASMGGESHAFEAWSGRAHALSSAGSRAAFAQRFLAYDGLPIDDRLHFAKFMGTAYARALSSENLEAHDDLCFSTWAIEHGLRPHVTGYSLFRLFREAYFNFPEQISAYHVLKTLRAMNDSDSAHCFAARGGMSDLVWGPLGRYFASLGGTIEPYTMALDWIYDGRRITGVRVARPDARGHDFGRTAWSTDRIPFEEGSTRIESSFDAVLSTIPHAVFVGMNASDERLWSSRFFAPMKNLRSAPTIAMRIKTERAIPGVTGPVHGLRAPLGIVVDGTSYIHAMRGERGSWLDLVGQESGFESWTDEQITAHALAEVRRLGPSWDLEAHGLRYVEMHRNRSAHERILLCEPGVNRFRPGVVTPFTNFFLAGDWVRNDVDLICMEGAIASGERAADAIVERWEAWA